MKSLRIILGSALFVIGLLCLIFFRGTFITILRNGKVFLENASKFNSPTQRILDLEREVTSLKFELNRIEVDSSRLISGNMFLESRIHSRYPFNNRKLLILDKGEISGVTTSLPVFAGTNLLVGKIESVKNLQSEVMTIFDPDWKTSVIVGGKKIKALLIGGDVPYLEFLPKDAPVSVGDLVWNISPEFPMNALLGEVVKIEEETNEVWKKAEIRSLYTLEDLESVFILKKFP